ncbi:hypothetical protein FS837_005879 [Tulasnella sp. UAMH 9824]|nr:hypothetical protein FS837_005879 [Tulasnella sp. UAMH 9824]
MNVTAHNPLSAPIFDVPEPPNEFGQDGGKFYRCYDALAEEIDEDMTQGLKEQLDGMLIFVTQNNAILIQLLMGRNDTIPANPVLPSTEFSPSHDIYTINTLFSLSLAFAIISSFLAMLGRQWLVYYRKRGGGGPDARRWTQLKRYLGAERWGLEPILDDVLPSLLQIGLIIFCASLLLYLRHLSPSISLVVGIPMYLGLAFFIGSAFCIFWDKFCPFHSPLSHLLVLATRSLPLAPSWIMETGSLIVAFLKQDEVWEYRYRDQVREFKRRVCRLPRVWLRILRHGREEERLQSLQAAALHRTICTLDDPIALLTAVSNALAIRDAALFKQLTEDSTFRDRFCEVNSDSNNRDGIYSMT